MSKVQYSRIGTDERLSVDYSSAFTYNSTQNLGSSSQYSSPFTYSRRNVDQPSNIKFERGLKHKTLGVKLLHWGALAVYMALIVLTLPISIWFVIKRAKSDEQIILSRLGIVKCIKGPTVLCVVPCIDKIHRYQTTLRAFNVPPQKVATSNGLLVELGAVVRYYIIDAEKAFFGAQNLDHTLRVTAQSVTANYITRVDEKRLTDNGSINEINIDIKAELQKAYSGWGITVHSFEICGLRALLRIEQEDAISNVIEPLKQWFFGGGPSSTFSEGLPAVLNPGCSPAAAPPVEAAAGASVADLENLRHKLTPSDLLAAVKSICDKRLVEQVGVVYKFIIPGDAPGVYYMDLKNGTGDCGSGDPPSGEPDTTITISLQNMQKMFTGALQPFDAYMSGDLKISGDIGGAMKLDQLVKTIASITSVSDTPAGSVQHV